MSAALPHDEFRSVSLDTPLAGAIECAQLGLPVFPVHGIREGACNCPRGAACESAGKHPILRDWQRVATTDTDIIRRWAGQFPDCNYGIPTGMRSGVVVVEVDPYQGGHLRDVHPRPELVSFSGRGIHCYFAVNSVVQGGDKKFGPGLGLRGEGHYVVAPGSIHQTGRRYGRIRLGWHKLADGLPILPAPGSPVGTQRRAEAAQRDVIPAGRRHATLLSLAGVMRRRGMSGDAIYAALSVENEARCVPPKSDEEIRKLAYDVAQRYPPDPDAHLYDKRDLEAVPAAGTAKKRYLTSVHRTSDDEPDRHPYERVVITKQDREPLDRIGFRTDDEGLIYTGRVNVVVGEPGSMKTFMCLVWAAQELKEGRDVFWLDYEEPNEEEICDRLRQLGLGDEHLYGPKATLHYYSGEDGPIPDDAPIWEDLATSRPTLIVIDSWDGCMAAHGLDPMDNGDVEKFNQRILLALSRSGAAVVLPDHVVKKQDDRGKWAAGSQRKKAVTRGSMVDVKVTVPGGKNRKGKAEIRLMKDTPGDLRRLSEELDGFDNWRLGWFELDGTGDHLIATFSPPAAQGTADPRRLHETMALVSVHVAKNPDESFSKNDVVAAVPRRREYVLRAINELIANGYLKPAKSKERGSSAFDRIQHQRLYDGLFPLAEDETEKE